MIDKGRNDTLTAFSPLLLAMLVFDNSRRPVNAENGLTGLRLGSVSVDGQTALRLVVGASTPATVKMSLLTACWLVIDMRDVLAD